MVDPIRCIPIRGENGDVGGDAAVMMKMTPNPARIFVVSRIDAPVLVPPPNPFWRRGLYEFWCLWISDL
jgi:hypothetical protein